MKIEEAIKVLDMFLYKGCDLERTKFAYDENTVWEAVRLVTEIADRLEQADAEEAKNIYCQELSCAGLCDECDHLEDFAEGYKQAIKDIRGDADE